MCYILGFVESTRREHHMRSCFGPTVLLTCKNETRLACGYRPRHSYFLCVFHKLIVKLINVIRFPKLSALLSYEIVQKLPATFHLYDYHTCLTHKVTENVPFLLAHLSNEATYQSYLYTIWAVHGLGISIKIADIALNNQTNVFVNIYDGPILVTSSTLNELASNRFRYKAGFRITIGFTILDDVVGELAKLSYSAYYYTQQVIPIDKYEKSTLTISIDTAKRNHNQIFYYKYITVVTINSKFVQMTFTNLTKFSEMSEGCEDGGFVLSDNLQDHFLVTGPFCSQHGTEPLVNAINTFYSSHNFITIFVYSYKFQMKVDIVFRQTSCEGITNPCIRFCKKKQPRQLPPQNYRTTFSSNVSTCGGNIFIERGCVVVQKTPTERVVCDLTVIASVGQIKTSNFRVINNIR